VKSSKPSSFGKRRFGLGGSMLAFALESELLSNESVGSALLVLDVIRCFYVLDLASTMPLLPIVSWTTMVLPVTAIYIGGRLDPRKNLDLKSGETTR
jgi:hypothetical protein